LDYSQLPDTFYRVSVKALIFDDQQRLLVFRTNSDEWQMPGGGLEHGETLAECLQREFQEEMHAQLAGVGDVTFAYVSLHPKGYHKLSLAVSATLESGAVLNPSDDNLAEARFVSKDEFLGLVFEQEEQPIVAQVDKIWAD
jgi:ADP-ribose pyrophosphatase YjhB (NUDIX family)